jgi:hypothetical protein
MKNPPIFLLKIGEIIYKIITLTPVTVAQTVSLTFGVAEAKLGIADSGFGTFSSPSSAGS